MSGNSFGWVEIKDNMIWVHRMTHDDKVIVDKYENEEIINKVFLFDELKKRLIEGAQHYVTLMELEQLERGLTQ